MSIIWHLVEYIGESARTFLSKHVACGRSMAFEERCFAFSDCNYTRSIWTARPTTLLLVVSVLHRPTLCHRKHTQNTQNNNRKSCIYLLI